MTCMDVGNVGFVAEKTCPCATGRTVLISLLKTIGETVDDV
jgi:hypothetical protein